MAQHPHNKDPKRDPNIEYYLHAFCRHFWLKVFGSLGKYCCKTSSRSCNYDYDYVLEALVFFGGSSM